MNVKNTGKKLLSLICLFAGLILFITSLIMDFSGSDNTYRGAMLVAGMLLILAGMFTFPSLKYHRTMVNIVFLFPLLFTFAITVIIPLILGIGYSFTDWNGIKYAEVVGLDNYLKMFRQPSFIWSIFITFLFDEWREIRYNYIQENLFS